MEIPGIADSSGVSGAADVIGLDLRLGTPGKEFVDPDVHFFYGDRISHVSDVLIHAGTEFRIRAWKIARARGLQSWILGFGDEECIRDGFHREERGRSDFHDPRISLIKNDSGPALGFSWRCLTEDDTRSKLHSFPLRLFRSNEEFLKVIDNIPSKYHSRQDSNCERMAKARRR